MIASLGDGVRDTPTPQEPSVGIVAVAPIGQEVIGTFAWTPRTSLPTRYPDRIEHRPQLSALVALTFGDQDRKRPALAVTGEVDLRA